MKFFISFLFFGFICETPIFAQTTNSTASPSTMSPQTQLPSTTPSPQGSLPQQQNTISPFPNTVPQNPAPQQYDLLNDPRRNVRSYDQQTWPLGTPTYQSPNIPTPGTNSSPATTPQINNGNQNPSTGTNPPGNF